MIQSGHGVHVEIRRLPLSQFNARYTERPHINLTPRNCIMYHKNTKRIVNISYLLNRNYQSRLYINLSIVLALVHGEDDLRRHPVGSADKAVGWALDAGAAEVS